MPVWQIDPVWLGDDVFIIGGGYSLQKMQFDWSLLHNEHTIGCNDAYIHGEKVCKICFFGDMLWYKHHRENLSRFSNPVFTNVSGLKNAKVPWLWFVKRYGTGLRSDGIGWNGNTGAAAINLAILLGARRIYLLGFDMQRIDDKANWHKDNIRPDATKPGIYKTFVESFQRLVRDWKAKFSSVEIYNVTDCSALSSDLIPWLNPTEFWSARKKERLDNG